MRLVGSKRTLLVSRLQIGGGKFGNWGKTKKSDSTLCKCNRKVVV